MKGHDDSCQSLRYRMDERLAAVHGFQLTACMDCGWLFRDEGIWTYEAFLHGKREEQPLCHCCWKKQIAFDSDTAFLKDATVSTRFFRWMKGSYDLPWWKPGMIGAEENCNRTIGVRTPWGLVFVCLNMPLRQKPCTDCLELT